MIFKSIQKFFFFRELKEEHNTSLSKETEYIHKRKDLEKRCELAETETAAAKADLRLALKRIEDLQSAIQGELEDTNSDQTDRYFRNYFICTIRCLKSYF